MKIEEAKICLDCDEIYEGSALCPNCGGRIGWPLKEWIGTIGRETEAIALQAPSTAELLFGERPEKIRPDQAIIFYRA